MSHKPSACEFSQCQWGIGRSEVPLHASCIQDSSREGDRRERQQMRPGAIPKVAGRVPQCVSTLAGDSYLRLLSLRSPYIEGKRLTGGGQPSGGTGQCRISAPENPRSWEILISSLAGSSVRPRGGHSPCAGHGHIQNNV